jgi:cobalamin biosynthesis Mg chelatase CobN
MTSTAEATSTADVTSTADMTLTADATSTVAVSKSSPSANTVTVPALDSINSTFDRSILIGALLPIFSVILLVLLAVTIIISTLWKAKQKKKEMDLQDSHDGLT